MTKLTGTITFPVKKLDRDFSCDLGKLSEQAVDFIFAYGLRQYCNDGHNTIALYDAQSRAVLAGTVKADSPETRARKMVEVEAAVLQRLDSLYNGTFREGSGGGHALTPVEQECRAIIAALLGKKGVKKGDADKAAVKWRDVLKGDEAKIAAVVKKAEANVASRDLDGIL